MQILSAIVISSGVAGPVSAHRFDVERNCIDFIIQHHKFLYERSAHQLEVEKNCADFIC